MRAPVLGGERFTAALQTPFYPETISVYAVATNGSDSYGDPVETVTLRSGLGNVPAAATAIQSGKIIQREEDRLEDLTRVIRWYRLQTPGDHHEITNSDRVEWRGDYWHVNSAVVDPSGTFTEILVYLTTPGPD